MGVKMSARVTGQTRSGAVLLLFGRYGAKEMLLVKRCGGSKGVATQALGRSGYDCCAS